jgi:hypothetical protein
MVANAAEEFVAIDGIVATGENGVAVAPTDAGGDLGVTWTDHGLTTDAGVTRSQPVSSTTRRAWQNRKKLRTIVTEAAVRFQFVLVQTNEDNIALFHGVPLTAGSLVTDPGREWPLIAFDLDMIDTDSDDDDTIREYAPSARVVEVGDQVALAGGGLGWPITVEAEYDAGIGGYTKQFYSKFEEAADPVIATVTAAGTNPAGTGDMVVITGQHFTGATNVTIDSIAMTEFEVHDSTTIYAVLPTDDAGAVNVVVTTPSRKGGGCYGVNSTPTWLRSAPVVSQWHPSRTVRRYVPMKGNLPCKSSTRRTHATPSRSIGASTTFPGSPSTTSSRCRSSLSCPRRSRLRGSVRCWRRGCSAIGVRFFGS